MSQYPTMQDSTISNLANAEAGGYPEQQQQDSWWLNKYSSWLSTIGAVFLAFVGFLGGAINLLTFDPLMAIASALQVVAAGIILAIEGSFVVSFLTFAKPIGMFFEGKPLSVKTTVYGALTIIPLIFGAKSFYVCFGFIISACITAIYGMILIGRKGNLDAMRAAAAQPTI